MQYNKFCRGCCIICIWSNGFLVNTLVHLTSIQLQDSVKVKLMCCKEQVTQQMVNYQQLTYKPVAKNNLSEFQFWKNLKPSGANELSFDNSYEHSESFIVIRQKHLYQRKLILFFIRLSTFQRSGMPGDYTLLNSFNPNNPSQTVVPTREKRQLEFLHMFKY